jgi:hypothetical protein
LRTAVLAKLFPNAVNAKSKLPATIVVGFMELRVGTGSVPRFTVSVSGLDSPLVGN